MSIYSDVEKKNIALIDDRDDCDYTQEIISDLSEADRKRLFAEQGIADALIRKNGSQNVTDEDLEHAFMAAGLEQGDAR